MAKARALDKRRKSVRNIRKITRTMELVATAQFKRAMDRAIAAGSYTDRITALVGDLARAGLEVSHPLLEERKKTDKAVLLVLTANRGMCGGYNSSLIRMAIRRWREFEEMFTEPDLEVSGKRGISNFRFNGIEPDEAYQHFEHKPTYDEVDVLGTRFLEAYEAGEIDRLEVVYTKFETMSRQHTVCETLLPMTELGVEAEEGDEDEASSARPDYEFLPSAASILDEVVPSAFKVKLFKCFLDSAVSEQIARMVAMKAATENADSMISQLTMNYNRARQGQITNEILEVISGAEALG